MTLLRRRRLSEFAVCCNTHCISYMPQYIAQYCYATMLQYMVEKQCLAAIAQNGGWGLGGWGLQTVSKQSDWSFLHPAAAAVAMAVGAAAKKSCPPGAAWEPGFK